jgi:hypothetical protein
MLAATDIFRFQLGNEGAIRRVLESRWSLVVGSILVVTAGVARHYDQKYLIWEWWVVQPFMIAVVSSFAIFLTAWIGLRMGRPKRDDRPHFLQQYLSFLGAFLMTSPLAWLYAIPVEQWMSLENAARVNIALLALVAFWRVALMVRVLCLVTKAHWLRCLVVVLLPSSVEALYLSVVMHMQLVGMMGGVQLPPHENILAMALEIVTIWSFWIAVATFVLWIILACTRKVAPVAFPNHRKGLPKPALIASIAALVAWTAYAWPWQVKQYHRYMVRHYIRQGDYRSALQFSADRNREAFPLPGHLPPDPLDPYSGTSQLIEILKALQESHPLWLREEYYRNAEMAVFSRNRYSDVGNILQALVSTPGGIEFVRNSPPRWLELLDELGPKEAGGYYNESYYEPYRSALERSGIDLPPHPGPAGEYRID